MGGREEVRTAEATFLAVGTALVFPLRFFPKHMMEFGETVGGFGFEEEDGEEEERGEGKGGQGARSWG